jgi:predicted GH43/DUF377 family glycosyl hydrolase
MYRDGKLEWELGPFIKADEINPILLPEAEASFICPVRDGEVNWEEKDLFNPTAVVRDGEVHLLYRAEDRVGKYEGTSRIGHAVSRDGLQFKKEREPVLYPEQDAFKTLEWEGGCEDPRIVEDTNGTYYMMYTAYDGIKARLCVATSTNLTSWTKHGLAFGQALDGKYADIWSKSGAIVTKRVGEKFIAERIDGLYWMYWGESNIYAATSLDLIHWAPVEAEDPRGYHAEPFLHPLLSVRKHHFDSDLIEPGPQAIIMEQGILLIYNSKNHGQHGDPNYTTGAYCAAQVLFDLKDPSVVIARSIKPFLMPDKEYEINGQINHVCFVEGLVYHEGAWLLYYGTADSKIAVARCVG